MLAKQSEVSNTFILILQLQKRQFFCGCVEQVNSLLAFVVRLEHKELFIQVSRVEKWVIVSVDPCKIFICDFGHFID